QETDPDLRVAHRPRTDESGAGPPRRGFAARCGQSGRSDGGVAEAEPEPAGARLLSDEREARPPRRQDPDRARQARAAADHGLETSPAPARARARDRKSTRLNSSH